MTNASCEGEVRVPDLGEVGSVTVVEWLAKPGDTVESGAALLEVETEKTTFVIDAPRTGRLARVFVKEGEKARRDDLLARID